MPGDYEAITSQGAGGVAIHQLEHPGRSDVGVYLCRSLLRDALRGKTGPDPTRTLSEGGGDPRARYTSDTVVEVAKLAGNEDIVCHLIAAGAVESSDDAPEYAAAPDNRKHRGAHRLDLPLR